MDPPERTDAAKVDQVVLAMVKGKARDELRAHCLGPLGMGEAEVEAVIAEARRRITVCADYDRAEQIGMAMRRCERIIEVALTETTLTPANTNAALAAQREINKLLGLYDDPSPEKSKHGAGATDPAAELEAIRGHLMPLELVDPAYPLSEHARVAAINVLRARASSAPVQSAGRVEAAPATKAPRRRAAAVKRGKNP